MMSNVISLDEDVFLAPVPHFSDADNRELLKLMQGQLQVIKPWDGTDYSASWLLNNPKDDCWITTTGKEYKDHNNKWKRACIVTWDLMLPNHSLLTDSQNAVALEAVQSFAFLYRSGYLQGHIPKSSTWHQYVSFAKQLLYYLFLYEDRFKPAKYGFEVFNQSDTKQLFIELATGNWGHAFRIVERCLAYFWEGTFTQPCPESQLNKPLHLDTLEISAISHWLSENDFYYRIKNNGNGYKTINRARLSSGIGMEISKFSTQKLSMFFRQFEPDLTHPTLLLPVKQTTQKPSHKTPLLADVINKQGAKSHSLYTYLGYMNKIIDSGRHGVRINSIGSFDISELSMVTKPLSSEDGHTPFMSINLGLHYLNRSIEMILHDAKEVFDTYLRIISYVLNPHPEDKRSYKSRIDLLDVQSYFSENESILKRYKINTITGLAMIVRALIGAIVLNLAILKPSRDAELTHLQRDCLLEGDDGYWINFQLGKSGELELNEEAIKPITFITAKGIDLMATFGKALSKEFGLSAPICEQLFLVPSVHPIGACKLTKNSLNVCLDDFCDLIDAPVDEHGRRWYVRIHEMRKWFLLLLFWSGRYGVLEAARNIAGHKNAEHIYAYIERNFPREEFTLIESEFAEDKLAEFERTKMETNESKGITDLYHQILDKFGVKSLQLIPENEWHNYVLALREDESFKIIPSSIIDESGELAGINIYFELHTNDK